MKSFPLDPATNECAFTVSSKISTHQILCQVMAVPLTARHLCSLALLLLLITNQVLAATPSSWLETFFLLDSHPKSLQASFITKISETSTFQLSCPTGTSPDNIACQKENRYPALVSHSPGSVFAGAFSTPALGISTLWSCALGSGSDDTIPNQNGICNWTVIKGPSQTAIYTTAMNSCYVNVYQVPITFTNDLEKLTTAGGIRIQDGPQLQSIMEEDAKEACGGTIPDVTTTDVLGSTTVSGAPTGASLFPGSVNPATITPTSTGTTPSTTSSLSTATSPTASKSNGLRAYRVPRISGLFIGVAIAVLC
jgi:hypothetical protein